MRDEARLLDMLRAAGKARGFAAGMTREGFDADEKTQFAVVRAIEIIGEAATHVDEETRSRHAEIPWKELAGMRTILAHEYSRIDLDIVWQVVNDRLPPLIEQLEAIVPPEVAE